MNINPAGSSTMSVALTPLPPPTSAFFNHDILFSLPPASSSPLRCRSSSLSILVSPLKPKPGRPTNRRNEVRTARLYLPMHLRFFKKKKNRATFKTTCGRFCSRFGWAGRPWRWHTPGQTSSSSSRKRQPGSRCKLGTSWHPRPQRQTRFWVALGLFPNQSTYQGAFHRTSWFIASRDSAGLGKYIAIRYGAMLLPKVDRLVKAQRRQELTTVLTSFQWFVPELDGLLFGIISPRGKQPLLDSGQAARHNHGLVSFSSSCDWF